MYTKLVESQKKGRPSKIKKELINSLLTHIREGCTFKDACALECISESTFYKWKTELPEFSESVKKAEIAFKKTHIRNIAKASEKQWQASAWLLERKFKREFGIQHQILPESTAQIDYLAEAEARVATNAAAKYQKPPVDWHKVVSKA